MYWWTEQKESIWKNTVSKALIFYHWHLTVSHRWSSLSNSVLSPFFISCELVGILIRCSLRLTVLSCSVFVTSPSLLKSKFRIHAVNLCKNIDAHWPHGLCTCQPIDKQSVVWVQALARNRVDIAFCSKTLWLFYSTSLHTGVSIGTSKFNGRGYPGMD